MNSETAARIRISSYNDRKPIGKSTAGSAPTDEAPPIPTATRPLTAAPAPLDHGALLCANLFLAAI